MYHPLVDCSSLSGIIVEIKQRLLTFDNLIAPYAMKSCPLGAAVSPRMGVVHGNLLPPASAHAQVERRVGCIEYDDPRTQGGSDASPSLIPLVELGSRTA